jgi:hypothetical protein
MAVSNEVTVDRLALKRAVSKLRSGPESEGDLTLLYVEDGGFWVETRVTATNLKAVGQWEDDIAVHAPDLQRVVSELPPTKEVTLLYSGGWLFVGDERLPAREIGSD